jgi:uncharacterized protein YchJ
MTWWNPFKKEGEAATQTQEKGAAVPEIPKELADSPMAKGLMATFYRKWKDPAFLKQLRVLAAHMQKDGVDIKDMKAVQAWLEKNKALVESGKLPDLPEAGAKIETYVKTGPEIGRNDPCPCGSGKKYKKCCASKA